MVHCNLTNDHFKVHGLSLEIERKSSDISKIRKVLGEGEGVVECDELGY